MKNKFALDIFHAALDGVSPYTVGKEYAAMIKARYTEGGFTRLFTVGFGKGAYPMARAAEETLGGILSAGVIVTKYGHCDTAHPLAIIKTMEAGHPLPDEASVRGAAAITSLLREADEKTLVLCLISGGGSALLAAPAKGITLAEKQALTTLLLRSGASIHEMNAVRKHLSLVTGGRLAEAAWPATVISLIVSDVIGDNIDVISSGPTAPDESTFGDALAALEKYRLMDKVPASIANHLRRGAAGSIAETPKPGNRIFERTENIIAASNITALLAAAAHAERCGLAAKIISAALRGDARDAARSLAEIAITAKRSPHPPLCLISGGETTVKVTGDGKGGRNMELALAFALAIEGENGITFLSAGTDGTDGPTDAAGAVVDGDTAALARARRLDPAAFLARNDSYAFFDQAGGLLKTGPTGTNVMDVQIILIA